MRLLGIVAALGLLLAACGGEPDTADTQGAQADTETGVGKGPAVVVTTNVLGDVVRTVAADAAQVEVLMPIGADPHSFEPSAQQVQAMQEADLIVANGLGLEEQLIAPIESAQAQGVLVLAIAEEVDPIPFGEMGHSDHDDDDHPLGDDAPGNEGQDEDPHFWLDPVRMAEGARLIGAELAALTGNADEWNARAEEYAGELEQLNRDMETQFAAIPDEHRKLVTNHEAFGYFAARYDFELVGAVIPGGTTLEEPSAADLQELAAAIEEERVPAIFAENIQPARLAEALAEEVELDVEVVALYTESLGEEGTEADTYIRMMQANAQRISEALTP